MVLLGVQNKKVQLGYEWGLLAVDLFYVLVPILLGWMFMDLVYV